GGAQKALEFVRDSRLRRIAIVHNDTISRDQFLALGDEPALYPEWSNGHNTPIRNEPGQIFVVSRIGEDREPRRAAAPYRSGEIDPTRRGVGDCFAAGASGIVL